MNAQAMIARAAAYPIEHRLRLLCVAWRAASYRSQKTILAEITRLAIEHGYYVIPPNGTVRKDGAGQVSL